MSRNFPRQVSTTSHLCLVVSRHGKPQSTPRRVFKAALIQLPGGAVSCVVRDLSETGALLEVPSQLGIPHEFSLRIPTAELDRPCRAVWRSAKGIGIAFVSGKSLLP
ncbi:pilus assembly protein PilZ [Bradyrhizobium sp. MOS002]|nr:pilus assembly protein PilZ [Bradyrhizobium sp. MOS002]